MPVERVPSISLGASKAVEGYINQTGWLIDGPCRL